MTRKKILLYALEAIGNHITQMHPDDSYGYRTEYQHVTQMLKKHLKKKGKK